MHKRRVHLERDPEESAKADTRLTVRTTVQAGISTKGEVGLSDLVIPRGRVITYRTKGTLGITG